MVLTKRADDASGPMKRSRRVPTGKIPQVPETFGYLAGEYAILNEHQLALGESTFEGRKELQSEQGIVDCDTLSRLILERGKNRPRRHPARRLARRKIRLVRRGRSAHGRRRPGSLGHGNRRAGQGRIGAVWAAQRVPDDQVSVVANGSRIGEIDLSKPDFFLASKNVFATAEKLGYWNPKDGRPFQFCDAYDPEARTDFAVTRREWRVSRSLGAVAETATEQQPFSVLREAGKARLAENDHGLVPRHVRGHRLRHGEESDGRGQEWKDIKSPLANPFMPYEMNPLFHINGGWGALGERPLARWFCMYVTVTQSRDWLPDPIGGVAWLGYANPAMTTYVPIYAGVTDLPEEYKTDGRTTGFSRRSAFWAFRQVATLAAHRWGDMRVDVAKVRDPMQEDFLARQKAVAAEAGKLLEDDPAAARAFLTQQTVRACRQAVDAYWDLGSLLWNKYDEQW